MNIIGKHRVAQKIFHCHQAMKYCELSMYVNPQFREAVKDGKKPWEASQTDIFTVVLLRQ